MFSGEIDEHGIRAIEYRDDHWVDNFPLIWSSGRQFDAREMNLYLEHRYKGLYRAPKRAARSNSLGGVSVKTLQSIANSLCVFLSWLAEENVDWRQVTAQASTQRAKYWLPVYRFRKLLINEKKVSDLFNIERPSRRNTFSIVIAFTPNEADLIDKNNDRFTLK